MAETIEVAYKPVAGIPRVYHKYIVYTNSAGQQFYIGIYPENYTFSEYATAGASFGQIDYLSGVYDGNSRDWDPSLDPDSTAKSHHRETIKTSDGSLLSDGKVDNTDARFTNLRVWRDLNQDGISQASELTTLADANIAAINVAKTANSQTLANGNQIADLGTYVKTDGSTHPRDTAPSHQMADINLFTDTFHRQFTSSIPITPETAALPNMRGSGAMRNLREAANDAVCERAA